MRYSKLFGKTRYNTPADADSKNAQLLTQAGFIERLAAGIYNILPLGYKVFTKIVRIIREEMNAVDSQEILMPALHPIELWETTGRSRTMDDILYRVKGAGGKDFVFGPSHEETVTPLAAKCISSYKDMPLSVYQIQTKFRNEPRAKSGILRGREFGMKDMYSFHTTEEDLDKYYDRVAKAYFNVFERCGLKSYMIEASGGPFSDKYSHEFTVETSAGEDTVVICKKCDLAQNLEIAVGEVPGGDVDEKELPMKEVKIERGFSIKENAVAHKVPEYKILKTVVYEVEESGLIGIVIRGDLNVSDVKLENYLKKRIRPATPEKLKEAGLVQGYISPVNASAKIKISFIGDHSIENVKNFVTGGNLFAKDYVNANLGRDFQVSEFADLVEVKSGFKCKKCGHPLEEMKGVEVGNIFKLGTRYSQAFNLTFADKDGANKLVTMGCYGIGTTRLMGTIVEASHDEKGIIWPMSVAPYHVYLMHLGDNEEVKKQSGKLYDEMVKNGIEVIYDDRDERAGVKLNDADLIGIPIRVLVSEKSLKEDSVEFKMRNEKDSQLISLKEIIKKIQKLTAI